MNQLLGLPEFGVNFSGKASISGLDAFFSLGRNKIPQSPRQKANKISKAARERRLRILIVDDEKRFREAMAYLLTEVFNAKVDVAESGYNAINDLKEKNLYQVIFLDIKMPGMDGIETYRNLRKMKVTCPIIMMSAYADSEKWEEAKQLGVELIPKPFPENRLAEILKNISR